MKTTRLMTSTLIAAFFSVALATGGARFFAGDNDSGAGTAAPRVYQELTAQIRTDWLSPVSARRSLDQRNQALERWVAARGGWIQVVDTSSELRTRGPEGERLRNPAARFEQKLLIHVPAEHAPTTIEQALAGIDVTVASITAARGQQRISPRIEF